MVYRQLNLRLWANAGVELGAWALRRRRRLRVEGDSMTPTIRPGEFVLVAINAKPDVGSVVLVAHPDYPTPMIKRVGSRDGSPLTERLWLLSDNPAVGTDSRKFGAVEARNVMGVVTLVLNRPFLTDPGFL